MRDIAGEEYFEYLRLRRLKETKHWRLPRVPFRTIAILLLGSAVGALPFIVMNVDGGDLRARTIERVLEMSRSPSAHPESLKRLSARLSSYCQEGFKAIRQLENMGPDYKEAATSALNRLASLILHSKLQRKSRRVPRMISYADAVKLLLASPRAIETTWDALEVVVYGIEDTTLLLHARKKELGQIGSHAERALEKLREQAGS